MPSDGQKDEKDRPGEDLARYYVEAVVEQNRSASHVDRFTRKPWEGDAKGIDQAKEKFRNKHDGPGVVGFDFDDARICKKVNGGWNYVGQSKGDSSAE